MKTTTFKTRKEKTLEIIDGCAIAIGFLLLTGLDPDRPEGTSIVGNIIGLLIILTYGIIRMKTAKNNTLT